LLTQYKLPDHDWDQAFWHSELRPILLVRYALPAGLHRNNLGAPQGSCARKSCRVFPIAQRRVGHTCAKEHGRDRLGSLNAGAELARAVRLAVGVEKDAVPGKPLLTTLRHTLIDLNPENADVA
jgi:hypothetical protein